MDDMGMPDQDWPQSTRWEFDGPSTYHLDTSTHAEVKKEE